MAPAFARVSNNDLTLWLAGPQSSAARPMPDGRRPEPGGWNRFVVEMEDLVSRVAEMKRAGLRFRNDVVVGPDRKSTRLNSSHLVISYAVFCLKKKKKKNNTVP